MTGSTPRLTLGAPLSISKEAPALRVVWSMATGLMRTVREPTRKSKERASRRCATGIACEGDRRALDVQQARLVHVPLHLRRREALGGGSGG